MILARLRRPHYGAASLLCFAAAIFLAPAGARSQLDLRQREPVATPAAIEPPLVPVAPERDAFAPRAAVEDEPRPSPPALAPVARTPATLRALPRPIAAARIIAIATGAQPTAIVENNGTEHLVTLGDPLDGSTIVNIGEAELQLANGVRLLLEPVGAKP